MLKYETPLAEEVRFQLEDVLSVSELFGWTDDDPGDDSRETGGGGLL